MFNGLTEEEQQEYTKLSNLESTELSEDQRLRLEDLSARIWETLWETKEEQRTPEQEKINELEGKYMRLLAEFDNFRKRTEKEKEQMLETWAMKVLKSILPIIDNFERGLANVKPEEEGDPYVEGMRVIYNQLIAELKKLGVEPIEAVGCEFNPDFHNAVMQSQSNEYKSGFIAQELQKGYKYKDSVLRYSSVAVVP